MTPAEVRKLATALLGDHGIDVRGVPHALQYDRMSARQRELFAWVATIEPEYFGVCVVGPLEDGAADIATMETETGDGPYPVEAIQIVRVADVGTSDYTTGQRVRLVRTDDTRDLPPRMTYRSNVLRAVGTDLDGVVSIRVWYARQARVIALDGSGDIDLPITWRDILAFDLAKFLLLRSGQTAAGVVEYLTAEETKRLGLFEAHVKNSRMALESRFG